MSSYTRIEYGIDQPEEVCIKVFAPRNKSRIPSVFWVWKSADFQERESYDMLGISYDKHPHLKRILMPESWVGWPLRKDYIAPNFYESLLSILTCRIGLYLCSRPINPLSIRLWSQFFDQFIFGSFFNLESIQNFFL